MDENGEVGETSLWEIWLRVREFLSFIHSLKKHFQKLQVSKQISARRANASGGAQLQRQLQSGREERHLNK